MSFGFELFLCLDKVLQRKGLGTRKGGEFNIAESTVDSVSMSRRNDGVLGETTVTLRTKVTRVIEHSAGHFPNARLNKDPLIQQAAINLLAHGKDSATHIGALDSREFHGIPGPTPFAAGCI